MVMVRLHSNKTPKTQGRLQIRNVPQGLGKEDHISLTPGKLYFAHPQEGSRTQVLVLKIKALTSLPLSGQWLRFRADGSH